MTKILIRHECPCMVFQQFSFAFQTVYDEWFITLYNLVYTALPVLGMSLFDQVIVWSVFELYSVQLYIYSKVIRVARQNEISNNLCHSLSPSAGQDVSDVWSFQHPKLYTPGQRNKYFNKKAIFMCALNSCYSSMMLFFIPYLSMHDTVRDDGKDAADYQSFALITQTCLLFTVSIQVLTTNLTFNTVFYISWCISFHMALKKINISSLCH